MIRNRRHWDTRANEYEAAGDASWAAELPRWGIWGISENEVHLLKDVGDKETIELGCGTAYVSSWLARRGALPLGIDNSLEQLTNARRFQAKYNLVFPLIHGNAEELPFPDEAFDMAISEYGASIWCDPYRWIPEASRVLRPGGELRFLMNSALMMLCAPDEADVAATNELVRPYFGMHRFEWPDDDSVEFHLPHGEWIRLLRRNNFEILDLLELRPNENASTRYPFVTLEWAQQWPSEEVWFVRKT